ncbi:exopolyphosphatase [Aestuariibacter sp. GS-14]|uniref:exopolyphosphatase n=1 Tax=Aestuariibacter sp. GS-14 TaxID=2590670 RepID=UPI0011297D86|nr:exopolyphosphatase [Aestuariibacter sp. GS-14]TPV52746.1 exopolyphosphatase [Aestuariibacter sp. GS-14]
MSPDPSSFSGVESREVTKVAALDIGSNSFHLVVARIVAGSVQILHRVKQRVRLAEGLDDNNLLGGEAKQRGLDTLKVIADSLKGFEPDSVRIVATHTLRRAVNAQEFIEEALQILPYPIEVISGTEEARLIYSGVAHTNHDTGKRLVVDIGGGSTEFIIGEGLNPLLLRSLQMGCVSYTQRFFANGELKTKAFEKAITAAEQEMEPIEERYRRLGWQRCIGTSGTIKAICALVQKEQKEVYDKPITLKDLKTLMKQFIEAGHIDQLNFPEMTDDRRPVMPAGLCVLIGLFKALKIESLEYSPAALREGVLYQMEDELHNSDIRSRTASSLATRYDVDTAQAHLVLNTTITLFNHCQKAWTLSHPDYRAILGWAALLHEVGIQINTRGVQRHSAYILQNVDMPGFNQAQQELLATLVRFHRKKIRVADIPNFTQYGKEDVYRLIVLLRLGVLLNIKRQEDFLPDFAVDVEKCRLSLTFPPEWLPSKPIMTADLEREKGYQSAVGIELTVS